MIISTKRLALTCLFFAVAQFAKAQVKVGDNPTVINKGSILELESTDKGLLFPRVALTNTTTWSLITGSTPVAGMVVYNTKKVADGLAGTATYPTSLPDGTGLYYWDGTGWVAAKGLANETLTTLTKGLGADAGKYTYKNEAGTLVDIKIPQTGPGAPPVGSGSPGDIYVNTTNGAVYTYNSTNNIWEKLPETLTTLTKGTGADSGKFTYLNEAGTPVDIKVTQSGAGLPAAGTGSAGDVYINTTNGDVYTYNTTDNAWKKAGETLTTLTQGTGANAGKFTYLNEAGTPVEIKVTQSGAGAPTTITNPGTAGDVYVNTTTGDVYTFNGTTWVKANEVVTTLTKGTGADSGKFTYLNEAGTPVDIKVTQSGAGLPAAGTGSAGDVYINTTNGDVYTYNTTDNAWKKAGETLTTLTKGTGADAGKFTYLNEAGTPVDIKVTQSGAGAPTTITNPGTAGDVYVNTTNGDVYTFNGTTWVKANEVVTTLTQGTGANSGKFTYLNEAGTPVDIKVTQSGVIAPTTVANPGTAGDVYVNSATGEVYVYNGVSNTWVKAGETLTTLTKGTGADAGKFTYLNEAGTPVEIKVTQTGAGAPTTITNPGTAGDVYVNTTNGDVYTFNGTTWVKANEVVTTLTQGTGANSGKFTYLNEAGTPVDIKVTQSGVVAPTAVANPGTAGDVYVNSATGEVYVYNGVSNTWVKAGETLTTLTQGTGANAGKFTYLNEAGTPVDIKVTQSGAGTPTVGTNPGTAGDVYVNTTNGDVYTFNGTTWVKANEVVTTLTQGTGANSGKFTYLNEAGTPVDIKVTQSGVIAPTTVANPGTAGDVYVNSATGEVYVYNGVSNTWVKAGETLTTLTKGTGADAGKFTYLNEAGTPVDIKVTQTGTGAPASPGTAGDVYVDTATGDIYTYNGTTWVKQGGGSNNDWALLGNAGTNPANNFVGTTDNQDLIFKVNNSIKLVGPKTTDIYMLSGNPIQVNNYLSNPLAKYSGGFTTFNATHSIYSFSETGASWGFDGGAASGTPSAPGLPVNGALMSTINGMLYDGTDFVKVARMRMHADGTPSATSLPTKITFWTTPTNSKTGVERLTIKNNGFVGIGIPVVPPASMNPTNMLHVSATANPVRFEGLQASVVTTDKIVVSDANGVLKTVDRSTLATASTEPWNVQNSLTKATLNTENIYQEGKVAVGFKNTDGVTTKQLEVKGDFKSQTTAGTNLLGMEVNIPLLPGAEASGSYWATADYSMANLIIATKDDARATASAPGKISNFQVMPDAVNIYSKHGGEAKQSTLQLNGNDGRFSLYANKVTSPAVNWGAKIETDPADGINGLYLYHAGSTAAVPVNNNDKTQITIKKADGVTFDHHNPDGSLKSSYKFPLTKGTAGQVMTQSGSVDGRLIWTTPAAVAAATEPWQVQGGTTLATANNQDIYQNGSVGIGLPSGGTIPTFLVGGSTISPKLHVEGDIATTGKIYTTNSVYADYVFEKYFNGKSAINPNYEFRSLNYVRDFIKANNHLPGVTSIADLRKANNGYTFDMTKLTIQSLEKVEELYLHTIEQKDKIDAQQAEIEKLKKESEETKARLERLEKLLLGNK